MTRRPSAGRVMIALGVLAVAAVMLLRPTVAPPLYDGLGFPDEYYRWLDAPAGSPRTPPATPAAATVDVQGDGTNGSVLVQSREVGPQLIMYVSSGSFQSRPGARTVTVRGDPIPLPGPLPAGAVLASNVYKISVGADNGPVTRKLAFLTHFRADRATDQRVVLYRWVDGGWQQVVTAQAGTDIYAGLIAPPGSYALLRLTPGTKVSVEAPTPTPVPTWYTQNPAKAGAWTDASGQPAVSNRVLWTGVGAAVLLLAAGLLLARLAVRRRQAAATPPHEPPP